MIPLENTFKLINKSKLSCTISELIIKYLKLLNLKWYVIKPKFKKSICESQFWINTLSNGKNVKIVVNNVFRWGSFYIELNDKQKEQIISSDQINLIDYTYELIETWDGGCDFWIETVDEDSFNSEEQEEIENLIYQWPVEILENENDDWSRGISDDGGYDEEKMEANGWSDYECTYTIDSGFILEESEDHDF